MRLNKEKFRKWGKEQIMSKTIYHGGCVSCTDRKLKSEKFCMRCRYYGPNWCLTDLSNYPISAEEIAHDSICNKGKRHICLANTDGVCTANGECNHKVKQ